MAPLSPPNCSTEVGHGEQKHVRRRSAFGARLGGRGKPRSECGRSAHISQAHCDLLWCRRICRLRHAPQSKQTFHVLPVSIDATPCRYYCAACMSGRALDFFLDPALDLLVTTRPPRSQTHRLRALKLSGSRKSPMDKSRRNWANWGRPAPC